MNEQLASAIASALPGTWTVKPAFQKIDAFHLTNENEMRLYIGAAYNKPGMLTVRLSLPACDDKGNRTEFGRPVTIYKVGRPGSEAEPSMNVSESKTPSQIAKAIESRIMDECKRIYGLALEQMERAKAYHSGIDSIAESLANVLGTKPDERLSSPTLPCHKIYKDGMRGTATVSGASVTFDLYMNPDKALKLAKFLRDEIFN